MARTFQATAIFVAVLYFASLSCFAYGSIFIEGKVYCDTCRVQFETAASHFIEAADVKLECRNRTSGVLTFVTEGTTDKTGQYRLKADKDHQDDICEVVLVKSPLPDCNDLVPSRSRARVLVTANNGISAASRFANSLGFLNAQRPPICIDILKELGLPVDFQFISDKLPKLPFLN